MERRQQRDGSKETAAKRERPAQKKLRRSLFARQELRAAVAEASISDTGIAKLAREFVELSGKSPKQGTSNYRVVAPALQYEADVRVSI